MMKRKLAIAWLALTGLTALFVIGAWLLSSDIRHAYTFWEMARAASVDFAIMAPAIRHLRKGDTVPKKILYPCQHPGCEARYDETLDGMIVTKGNATGKLTGWMYPWDPEAEGDQKTHEHILNTMHKMEVDDAQ